MSGTWQRGSILTYSDFSSTGTTKAVTVYTIPGSSSDYWYIEDVILQRMTDFAGGSVTAATVQIGKSGDTAKYCAALTDVFTGAKSTAVYTIGSNTTSIKPAHVEAGQVNIQVLMTSTTDTLNHLTAGQLQVFVKLGRIPRVN